MESSSRVIEDCIYAVKNCVNELLQLPIISITIRRSGLILIILSRFAMRFLPSALI